MFNQELKKIENYNNEVQKFFIDHLVNDDRFNNINEVLDSKVKQEIYPKPAQLYILDFYKLDLVTRLTPDEFDVLSELFPKTMKTLTNGCKPDYMPSFRLTNINQV